MQVVVKGEVVMKGTMQGVMKGEGGHSHDDNYSHHGSANAGYWDTGCGIVAEREARGEEEDQTVRKHAARSSK